MIVANLAVTDMVASLAFYRDVLGFALEGAVTADRQMLAETDGAGVVFANLLWEGAQLMLQTKESMAEELPGITFAGPAGTLYLRGYDPDRVADRITPAVIVKGPLKQWYGMRELYLRDPDGTIICLGIPDGPAPS